MVVAALGRAIRGSDVRVQGGHLGVCVCRGGRLLLEADLRMTSSRLWEKRRKPQSLIKKEKKAPKLFRPQGSAQGQGHAVITPVGIATRAGRRRSK